MGLAVTATLADQQDKALARARQAWAENQEDLEKAERAFGVPFPRQAALIQAVTDLAILRNDLMGEGKALPEAAVKASVLPDYGLVRAVAKGGDRQSGYLAAAYGWPGQAAEEAKFSRRGGGEPTAEQLQKEYDATRARYVDTPQWLKAPNGKPSKLNERQWVQVRTPRFKAFFGDWEAALRQAQWRGLVQKALSDTAWQKRTVLAEGYDADPSGKLSSVFGFKVDKQYLTPDDIRKTDKRHGDGRERNKDQIGLRDDDYVKALEVLRDPQTFKKTTSNNGKPSAEFGRQFSDGNYIVAEVEVAETGAVSIKSAWKKLPGRIHAGAVSYPNRTPEDTAGSDQSIHSDNLIVNKSEVSKVVDENGEPLVVYHGTTADITVFDAGAARGGGKSALDKSNFYFAQSAALAGRYAGEQGAVYAAFLNIKKPMPYAVENGGNRRGEGGYKKDALFPGGFTGTLDETTKALGSGYDGIIRGNEIAAFTPNQIKSAIGNTGAFSQDNPDIRYRRGVGAGRGGSARPAADQAAARALNAGLARHFNDPSWESAYVQGDLPDGLAEFAEAARAAFGAEVVGIMPAGERFDQFNGIHYRGRNYVNLNAPVGFVNVAGHELFHQLKRDRPDLYQWFAAQARGHYRDVADYRDRLNALLGPGEQPYNTAAVEEELLADFAGDALADPAFLQKLAEADPGRFRRLLNAVRRWLHELAGKLRRAGLGSSQYFKDVETLRGHLVKALVAYGQGGPVAVGKVAGPKFHQAWHGSPHDHDGFSLEYVGTGESRAAFGEGLYFTDVPEIAEWYRDKLSTTTRAHNTYKGKKLSRAYIEQVMQAADSAEQSVWRSLGSTAWSNGQALIDKLNDRLADAERQAARFREREATVRDEDRRGVKVVRTYDADYYAEAAAGNERMARAYREVLANLERVEERKSGKLYQVELAPQADEYLDWHKPLSEQSERVRGILSNAGIDVDRRAAVRKFAGQHGMSIAEAEEFISGNIALDASLKGEELYRRFTKAQGSQKAASEYLHSLGIRGIRYPAEGGRKGGDRFNYVIFSDEDVAITAKFSRSAMKSPAANLRRGEQAMNTALLDKRGVSRAMYHPDLGWIDFVWGDNRKGIQHILKQRLEKDGMSADGIYRLLTKEIPRVIATGEVIRGQARDGSERVVMGDLRHEAVLVKNRGGNGWVLSAWEVKTPGAAQKANDFKTATPRAADSSDDTRVAGAVRELSALARRFVKSMDGVADSSMEHDDISFSRRRPDLNTSPAERVRESSPLEDSRAADDPDAVAEAAERELARVDAALAGGGGWKGALKRLDGGGEESFRKLSAKARRAALGALTVHQLVDVGASVLPRMREYLGEMSRMDATRNRLIHESDQLAQQWGKLPKAESARVGYVMHESTIAGADGAAGEYAPSIDVAAAQERIKALGRLQLGAGGDKRIPQWQEERRELQAQVAFEQKREKAWARVQALYDALTPAGQAVYRAVRDYHAAHLDRVEQALIEMIEKTRMTGKHWTGSRWAFGASGLAAGYVQMGIVFTKDDMRCTCNTDGIGACWGRFYLRLLLDEPINR